MQRSLVRNGWLGPLISQSLLFLSGAVYMLTRSETGLAGKVFLVFSNLCFLAGLYFVLQAILDWHKINTNPSYSAKDVKSLVSKTIDWCMLGLWIFVVLGSVCIVSQNSYARMFCFILYIFPLLAVISQYTWGARRSQAEEQG